MSTAMVLLYAYVRQRFITALAARIWSQVVGAALAASVLVVLWYACVILWVAFTGSVDVRARAVAAIAVWALVNMAVAHAVFCRFVVRPVAHCSRTRASRRRRCNGSTTTCLHSSSGHPRFRGAT